MASPPTSPSFRLVTDEDGKSIDFEKEVVRVEKSERFMEALKKLAYASKKPALSKMKYGTLKQKSQLTQLEATFVGFLLKMTMEDLVRDGRLYGPVAEDGGDGGGGQLVVPKCLATTVPFGNLFERNWPPCRDPDYEILDLYTEDRSDGPKLQVFVNEGSRCEIHRVMWNGVHFPTKKKKKKGTAVAQVQAKAATATATSPRNGTKRAADKVSKEPVGGGGTGGGGDARQRPGRHPPEQAAEPVPEKSNSKRQRRTGPLLAAARAAAANGDDDDDDSSVIDLASSDDELEDPHDDGAYEEEVDDFDDDDQQSDSKPKARPRTRATSSSRSKSDQVSGNGMKKTAAKGSKRNGAGADDNDDDDEVQGIGVAAGMSLTASPNTPQVIRLSLLLSPTMSSPPVPIPLSEFVVPATAVQTTNEQQQPRSPPPTLTFKANWFKEVVVREMLRPMLRAHSDSSTTFDFEETDVAFYLKDEETNSLVPMPGSLLKHLTSSPRVLGKESITVFIYVEGVSQVAFAMKQVEAVSVQSAHAPPVVSPVADSRSSSVASLKPASSDGTPAPDVAGLPRTTNVADAVGTAAPADPKSPTAPTGTSAFDEVGTKGSSIAEESGAAAVDSRDQDDAKKSSASISAAPHAGVDQRKPPPSSSSTPCLTRAPPSQEAATIGQGGGATSAPKTTAAATDAGVQGTTAALCRHQVVAERGADPVPMEAVSSMSGPPQLSLFSTWAAASISSLRLPVGTMATTSDPHVRGGLPQAAEDFRSLFSIASDDDDDDDDDDSRSSDNKNKRIVV